MLNRPASLAIGDAGELYVGDTGNCRVREIQHGTISTIAGTGTCGYAGDGGLAKLGELSEPTGLALVGGRLYVADRDNCRVRAVERGRISTVAGAGSCGFAGDAGPARDALLNGPFGLAVDGRGTVYVSDAKNCRIREIRAGIIDTFAGNGTCASTGSQGSAGLAEISYPTDLAVRGGRLYFVAFDQCEIEVVDKGRIATLVGTGTCGYGGDGGPAERAQLNLPGGIAVDSRGELYIADAGNNRVRLVSSP
jgi:NHL repeat